MESKSLGTRRAASALHGTLVEPTRRWRWYHGLLFYVFVQALSAALNGLVSSSRTSASHGFGRLRRGETRWSDTLKQPVFQPPNWMFPIAWPVNNFGEIYGALRVLNMPADTPGRERYLALQGVTWLDYVLFSAGYFGLRSPINSLILTAIYFLLTVASLGVALLQLKDSRVALSLATTFIWLLVALPSAVAQALWNRDQFYGVGPFARPSRALLKRR